MSVLVVLATLSGAAAVGGTATTAVAVDATPTDPNDAEATHTVVFTVGPGGETAGSTFDDVLVDYTAGAPEADVSNVGASSLGRIGIDRGGDDPGTRIDVAANVSTVSAKKDGSALRIATKGSLGLQAGDEVVVVLTPVQNPQNAGNATVEVTVNSQSGADNATGTVGYEYNDATVRFDNQTTSGETVTVESVSLSEGGFVAIQNRTGETPGEVRAASAYLPAGNHSDVVVQMDPDVDANATLYAQVYTDTNGDRRFRFDDTGGDVDDPYLTKDGNVMASDAAKITYEPAPTSGTGGDTATPTPDDPGDDTTTPVPDDPDDDTPTPSPTATPDGGEETSSPPPDETPTRSPSPTSNDGTATGTETPQDDTGNETTMPTDSPTETSLQTASDTVTESPTDEDRQGPGDEETPTGQPGFGLIAALTALAAVALLARR